MRSVQLVSVASFKDEEQRFSQGNPLAQQAATCRRRGGTHSLGGSGPQALALRRQSGRESRCLGSFLCPPLLPSEVKSPAPSP